MTTIKYIIATATALIAGLALAACTAAGPVQTPGITDPGTPTTPVETQEPAFDPADANQDGKVTAAEQEQWERKQPREYTKADGSTTTIVFDEPLPEDVKQDVAQGAVPAIPAPNEASAQSMRDYIAAKTAELGRPIVLVFSQGGQWVAMATGKKEGLFWAKATVEEAVAEASKYATTMGAELIVLQ